jgi:hypothetical protein
VKDLAMFIWFLIWIGATVYELISGKVLGRLGRVLATRDHQPKAYWFSVGTDLLLTLFFAYLAIHHLIFASTH